MSSTLIRSGAIRRGLALGVLLLAISTTLSMLAPQIVGAQESCVTPDGKAGTRATPEGPCVAVSGSTASSPAAASTPTPGAGGVNTDDMGVSMAWVMTKLMGLFAWLLGIAALTLENSVYYTVVTMGSFVNELSAIGVTWRILRDIGNIALLFGFIAIGVSIILDTERLGYGQKMLPTLLIVAVTLNFSLFVAQAVIDTGNLVATQFYTQINGGEPAEPYSNASGNLETQIRTEGISGKLMNKLGLQGIYGAALQADNEALFQFDGTMIVGFMGIFLFLTATLVFFSLAFVLIARFVALIFLMIFSPIGFAGLVVPKLENTAKQWWQQLFLQTFTAPVLLLGLYIALAVITDVHFLTGFNVDNTGWGGAVNIKNTPAFIGIFLSFIVAMGLLLTVVVLSKKLGAFGAETAIKYGGKLSFGLTGALARGTIGRTAQFATRRLEGGGNILGRVARVPIVGRNMLRATDKLAKSSFDVRATGVLKKVPMGGIDAGEAGGKGGFRAAQEQQIKDREEYAKRLKNTPKEQEQQKEAEAQKAQAERNKTFIGRWYQEALDALRQQQAAELEPLNEAVATAKRALEAAEVAGGLDRAEIARLEAQLAAARAAGDAAEISRLQGELAAARTVSNPAEVDRAQLALNNALRDVERIRAQQEQTRNGYKSQHDTLIGEQNSIIDSQKNTIDALKAKPAVTYAQRISTLGLGEDHLLGGLMKKMFYVNAESADRIIKSARKSKDEKNVDTLMDLLKKNSAPAAAPAAPAGGATP